MKADYLFEKLGEKKTAAQIALAESMLADAGNRCYQYPWDGIDDLIERASSPFYIVGYGSLLHPESAARTFPNTPAAGHPPVVTFGARRIYNYLTGRVNQSAPNSAPAGNRIAALNTDYTASAADWINGRLLPLTSDALAGFRAREKGYDLCPVACLWWDRPAAPPFTAYVLCATSRPWQGRTYVADNILPFPAYYQLCRAGAEMISSDYLEAFLTTTFLADGRTSLKEWEAAGMPDLIQ